MHEPINNATARYLDIKAKLIEQYDLAEDDEALADTLEGATDLHDLLLKVAREARRREAMADATAEIMKENAERKARHQRAADGLREAISHALAEAGLKKVEGPDLTLTWRLGSPNVEIVDEAALPAWATATKTVPDKKAIKEAFSRWPEQEFNCPGVVITNPKPVLTIRGR